jgi:hypothetical protein
LQVTQCLFAHMKRLRRFLTLFLSLLILAAAWRMLGLV